VKRVSDGGILVALAANGTKLRIRLLGIDVPEIAHGMQPLGLSPGKSVAIRRVGVGGP